MPATPIASSSTPRSAMSPALIVLLLSLLLGLQPITTDLYLPALRSEERRVGKECRL